MTTHNISLKLEDMDEIHDRIPILDLLINKWRYITKYKKTMLNKSKTKNLNFCLYHRYKKSYYL